MKIDIWISHFRCPKHLGILSEEEYLLGHIQQGRLCDEQRGEIVRWLQL